MAANFPLSVTLSMVDKATAPIRAFSASVKQSMAPVREIRNRLKLTYSDLGIPQLGKAFSGVSKAAGGVVKEIKGIGKELAIVGGLAAGIMGGIVYSTPRS